MAKERSPDPLDWDVLFMDFEKQVIQFDEVFNLPDKQESMRIAAYAIAAS
jgi:hypothetical protein